MITAAWRSNTYGDGSACREALFGETVHVVITYEGGAIRETYDCLEHGFWITLPENPRRVVVDVFGDSGQGYDQNTHVDLGTVDDYVDLGFVSIE